jgi:hypothetical protein
MKSLKTKLIMNIQEKNFEWGKVYRNGELVAGIVGALLAFVASRGDFEGSRIVVFFLFLVISVGSFIHYFYLTRSKTYVTIKSDGINVASRYFKSNGSFVKWTNISAVEKDDRKRLLTLSLKEGENVKIYLSSLNKDDHDDLIKIISEAVRQLS